MSRPDRAHPPAQLHSARGKFIPEKTAALLRQQIPFQPELAIVLGSGFQSLAGEMTNPIVIPCEQLPGFPTLTVPGHHAKIIAGQLADTPLLLLCGRSHFYEGHPYAERFRPPLPNESRPIKTRGERGQTKPGRFFDELSARAAAIL